jgi:F-type H+-transporting ATPase subunit epsilon
MTMADLFRLQIITPDRIFMDDDVERVVFKTTEGDIGVLINHIPLTTTLVSGVVKIKIGDEEKRAVLHGGFAEIKPDQVTVLADAAEWPEEVDLARAKEAAERAESRLNDKGDKDMVRAEVALMRALARIELIEEKENK